MGYRGQTGSRRGSGEKFQKSAHEKAKSKAQKNKAGKYVEETPSLSPQEIVEKTIVSLTKLGGQTFGLSPFSQYFDDWLVSLRQIISEFESSPLDVDETFVKERTQTFEDIERQFAERRLKEAEMDASSKALARE